MLFAAQTWPFTVAAFLLVLIAIVELLAMLVGASLSQSLDQLLADPGEAMAGPFDRVLSWLAVGRVPLLVLLVLFLALFALSGFVMNLLAHGLFGFWIPTLIAVLLAFVITVPIVRLVGGKVAKLVPQDRTFAVSFESLVGRVAKAQAVRQREVEAEREISIASIEQQRATQIADQNKAISIAQKSEEQSKAQASANLALAEAVKAEQAVKTAEEVAKAEREKQVTLVLASQEAERQAISVKVSALAEKEASEAKADAIRTLAKANRENYEAEAAGKRALNEAINTLSSAQVSLQEKLALIQALPKIIEEAVRPMQNIDSIRIMQVEGLNTGAAGAQPGENGTPVPTGNLAEQAVGAALKYRAYAPVLDQLIKEVGLSGNGLDGLVKATTAIAPSAGVPAEAS